MSRILVTGASGFLGSSVVPALVDQAEQVIATDLYAPDEPRPGVIEEVLDVTNERRVNEVIADHDVDVIVHLASIVTPPPGMSDAAAYRVDVGGTHHIVEAALRHSVRRLVVSSSGAAYGYHPDNPAFINEDAPARGSDAFAYSRHKAVVEGLLAATRAQHPELEQVVLRIDTILGERVDNQITDLFRRKRLIKVAGSDSPFVFIWDTDLTQIVVRAAVGDVTGVFNVAGVGDLTIDEIAQRLGKPTLALPDWLLRMALGVMQRIGSTQYGPEQVEFLQYRPVLDPTRLHEEFGFVPAFSSEQAFEAWLEVNPDARG